MHEEFNTAVLCYEDYSYTIKNKFDSGTTVEMVFWVKEYDSRSPIALVEVALHSYTKRRQVASPEFYYSVRGKDGLRPAIWATNLLLKFPEFLFDNSDFRFKDQIVYQIYWSDSRRRDVYHKWLSRHGFYFDRSGEGKCLAKIFTRNQAT